MALSGPKNISVCGAGRMAEVNGRIGIVHRYKCSGDKFVSRRNC
jgi:hypothetical protein